MALFEDSSVVGSVPAKPGPVSGERRGKGVFWSTNRAGQELCERYRQVCEACLMPGFFGAQEENLGIGASAQR